MAESNLQGAVKMERIRTVATTKKEKRSRKYGEKLTTTNMKFNEEKESETCTSDATLGGEEPPPNQSKRAGRGSAKAADQTRNVR